MSSASIIDLNLLSGGTDTSPIMEHPAVAKRHRHENPCGHPRVERRDLLMVAAGMVMARPRAGIAQWGGALVVGFLGSGSPTSYASFVTAFRQGLSEMGYTEEKNLRIEFRWAGGRFERLPPLAMELAERKVDVIATGGGTPSARAAKDATSAIPVVFSGVADPVGSRLVQSLEKPGGNLTGISDISSKITATRLELLSELVPSATLLGLLANPKNASTPGMIAGVEERARARNLQLDVLNATSDGEIDAALSSAAQRGIGAVIIASDPFFASRREQLVALTAGQSLPAIYSLREFVADGGLISYGASITSTYREMGIYVGKILKGAKPADLPVQQSTVFELAINVKTAKALNLAVPDSLRSRAELID